MGRGTKSRAETSKAERGVPDSKHRHLSQLVNSVGSFRRNQQAASEYQQAKGDQGTCN